MSMLIDRVAKSIEMALPNYCIATKENAMYAIIAKQTIQEHIASIFTVNDFTYVSFPPSRYNSNDGIIFNTIQTLILEFLQDNYVLHKLPDMNGRFRMYLITEKVYGD